MSPVTVGDIERAIAERFPLARAEEWDRCGLLVGDRDALVTGVTLALDPTIAAIQAAQRAGSNVLVTHHPAFLSPPSSVTAGMGPGGVVFAAASRDVALINAHTNLDRDTEAQALMPRALGLTPVEPLERSAQAMSVITVFVPADRADAVCDAMFAAGAGRIGEYHDCVFSVDGRGSFVAGESTHPSVGAPGGPAQVQETRVEVVCDRGDATKVVSAAVAAHPYEEPLIRVEDAHIARNAARLGMVSATSGPLSVGALARLAGDAFDTVPRVWGDPDVVLERVATATGSAGSLIADAIASGVGALVAGEVRYHDALDAVGAGLAVIELGHDVTEWPLVDLLAQTVLGIEGIDAESVGKLDPHRAWWVPDEERGAL